MCICVVLTDGRSQSIPEYVSDNTQSSRRIIVAFTDTRGTTLRKCTKDESMRLMEFIYSEIVAGLSNSTLPLDELADTDSVGIISLRVRIGVGGWKYYADILTSSRLYISIPDRLIPDDFVGKMFFLDIEEGACPQEFIDLIKLASI